MCPAIREFCPHHNPKKDKLIYNIACCRNRLYYANIHKDKYKVKSGAALCEKDKTKQSIRNRQIPLGQFLRGGENENNKFCGISEHKFAINLTSFFSFIRVFYRFDQTHATRCALKQAKFLQDIVVILDFINWLFFVFFFVFSLLQISLKKSLIFWSCF